MELGKFIKNLIITIIASALICFGLNYAVPQTNYPDITILGILLFALIAVGIYILGLRAIKTADKNFFIYVIVVNIFIKVIASFIVIGIYVSAAKPPNKLFLINFTIIYLVFTILETYFLSIQAKAK